MSMSLEELAESRGAKHRDCRACKHFDAQDDHARLRVVQGALPVREALSSGRRVLVAVPVQGADAGPVDRERRIDETLSSRANPSKGIPWERTPTSSAA